MTALAQPLALPMALVWIFFLGGPLHEEFGWRGYAFENLRGKMSAIYAAIAVGVLWSLCHLPLFFVPRGEFYYNCPAWGPFLTLILVGIILLVLREHERQCVCCHAWPRDVQLVQLRLPDAGERFGCVDPVLRPFPAGRVHSLAIWAQDIDQGTKRRGFIARAANQTTFGQIPCRTPTVVDGQACSRLARE